MQRKILSASASGQALQAGLIDRIGYLDDALAIARQRAGLTTACVVLYRRGNEYSENIYSSAGTGPAQVNLINLDFGALVGRGPGSCTSGSPSSAPVSSNTKIQHPGQPSDTIASPGTFAGVSGLTGFAHAVSVSRVLIRRRVNGRVDPWLPPHLLVPHGVQLALAAVRLRGRLDRAGDRTHRYRNANERNDRVSHSDAHPHQHPGTHRSDYTDSHADAAADEHGHSNRNTNRDRNERGGLHGAELWRGHEFRRGS